MRLISLIVFIFCYIPYLSAQDERRINLVKNGDFESGNSFFSSNFIYNTHSLSPGQYCVTNNAPYLNVDYVNPVNGDHTNGRGFFLIVDSDNSPGKKVWCSTVNVIPNSYYNFSAYFCNLFKHRGSNAGFVINGMESNGYPKENDCKIKVTINSKQIGETEADIFHLFRWVNASSSWYSGTNSGPVEICIENVNYRSSGNDLALDDIQFVFVQTMPKGYQVPKKHFTIMIHDEEENQHKYKVDKRRSYIQFKEIFMGDSLSPGIYTLYKKKNKVKNIDTLLSGDGRKIQFNKVIFKQGNADILPEALPELNRLAEWMINIKPNVRIRLEGHTDNQGIPELNVKLSESRVINVKQYLIQKGVDEKRIETIGYGGAFPIGSNTNEETRKLNRRVEFEILEK